MSGMPKPARAVLLAIVLAAETLAQMEPQAMTPSRQEIMERVVDMLRWKAYWEGSESFAGYYAVGKVVDTKIVRTSASIAVFITAAGVNFEFRPGASGVIGSFGPFIVGQKNDQAAATYLGNNCGGFKLKPAPTAAVTSAHGNVLPAERVCLGESVPQFGEEDFPFTLPALLAPDYVSRRSPPADALNLREVVDAAVRVQLSFQNTCKSARVTIPYYSSKDPRVFVYVDMGRGCEEFSGIFDMRLSPDGNWQPPGKLWGVRPPNDWSWTIRQIKRTTLITYEIR